MTEVSNEFLNAMLNYLAQRPYQEVYGFINYIQTMAGEAVAEKETDE